MGGSASSESRLKIVRGVNGNGTGKQVRNGEAPEGEKGRGGSDGGKGREAGKLEGDKGKTNGD